MFELFSGIGAPRSALINRAIPYESKGWSEVDKFAIRSYELLYNDTDNYGDIKKLKSIPRDLDLLFHGSPCQDFSRAGKGKGGELGSGTRSSLLWHTVRLAKDARPKVVIWENVLGLLQKKHKPTFDKYLKYMTKLGYTNSYHVYKGTDFNVPQTRDRVYVVSTLKQQEFEWPEPIPLTTRLIDVMEPIVDAKFYLTQRKLESIIFTDKMNDTIRDNAIGYHLGSRELKSGGGNT